MSVGFSTVQFNEYAGEAIPRYMSIVGFETTYGKVGFNGNVSLKEIFSWRPHTLAVDAAISLRHFASEMSRRQ
jgi:hypothetical protein